MNKGDKKGQQKALLSAFKATIIESDVRGFEVFTMVLPNTTFVVNLDKIVKSIKILNI
jgi:hypothetical protein